MSDRTLKEAISMEMRSTYHKRALYVLADAVRQQTAAVGTRNGVYLLLCSKDGELQVVFENTTCRINLEYNEESEANLANLEVLVKDAYYRMEEERRRAKLKEDALAKLSVEEREVLGLMGL